MRESSANCLDHSGPHRKKVEDLEAVLADGELGPEAMEAIRSMVTRIVLAPGEVGGMEAVLEGDLARRSSRSAKAPNARTPAGVVGVLVLFR